MKDKWENWKELYSDCIVSFAGLMFLIVFMMIEIQGEARIIEDNDLLRRIEMGTCVLVIALGIDRLIADWKRIHKK